MSRLAFAAYLMGNFEEVALFSAAELAERLEMSEATVVVAWDWQE